jgi:translation initiation factor 2-alpha kinase 4
MNYEEEQQQEIEALQSIFPPDDFELTVQPTAWSRTNERKVKLRIRSVLDDSQYIMLCAQLSATYPRSPPSLAIEGGESFHERTRNRIQTTIQKRPKQLLGSQMLWDISDEIREALDDAVSARRKGTLPSLDVERASAEEMASSLAKQAEEAEEQRLLKEKEEEAVAIQQMISQQMVKQEKRKSLRPTIQSPKQSRQHPAPEVISFGQSARIKVGNDTETFTAVTINGLISNTELEGTYLGTPLVSNSENRPPIVAIKRRTMKKPKEEIIALESILTRVQRLEHPHLLNVLAYRINQLEDSKSELVLCREHCNRGHLADQLSLGSLHTTKARQFTTELLEGLDYLHRHGIIHGFINTRSVYLATNPDLAAKLSGFGYAKALGLVDSSRPAKWNAPQTNSSASHTVQVQSDIWDLGVVAVQMFLGPEALEEHASPFDLIDRPDISDAFRNFLSKIFLRKEHISCFDLLPAELLRTNLPVLQPVSTRNRHQAKSSGSGFSDRGRYDSSTNFTQISRLGKGGFGEVVKARHKIDQSLYAIKKIKAQSGPLLDKLIAEAMLLGRLNHPYVVRYINTWIEAEELGSASTMDGNLSESEVHSDSECVSSSFNDYQLTSYEDDQSLDSKDDVFERDGSGESQDLDSDDDLFERDDQTSASSGELQATAAARRRTTRSDSSGRPTVLYIQMELCDGRSLSDAIRKGMGEEDAWMMLRRITEGLAHVHSHGIIHRDLKPDNIFIDSMGNPKIGDFGLATTGHYKIADRTGGSKGSASLEMTQGVGTALYVAPEIQSPSGRTYNEKVDMYSLGIIFFEMCQRFSTAMERIMELKQIRQRDHKLPGAFLSDGEKAAQGVLINCLISHDPSERPSSAELLRDSRMPANLEDQTIQEALRALSDESSPYHHRMLSALFAPSSEHMQRAKDIAWDAGSSTTSGEPLRVRLRSICQSVLEAIFRKHGGEEDRRDFIFPRSGYYASEKVMQVIDTSGNLLQLPYDQKLPYARQLARRPAATRCTFVFGGAYRNRAEGPPKVTFEADFDIVNDEQEEEPAANDAEVLKVLDESLTELPQFVANSACFHLSHGLLIDAILDHCRVPQHLQNKVKDIIERVPFDLKWPDARHQV